jgi:UDP-N-acetylglucosamine diphosphorylase/glucosamine-1-phosphate N-acetyltransferase
MKNIILFDDDNRDNLLPLTYTRPMGELRLGILTIKEKWEKFLHGEASFITQDYLSEKYPLHVKQDNLIINGAVVPTPQIASILKNLKENEAVLQDGELIATRLNDSQIQRLMNDEEIAELQGFDLGDAELLRITSLSDLFRHNDKAIRIDFELMTQHRNSESLSESNLVRGADQIFVEAGAEVECCILNAETGPIYIGKDVKILEGAMLRGPIALCEGTVVKMGAKIYGASTFGPFSKVGGEINNSILFGHSNKGHDGYIGNTIIGEWCNLGADSNTSNMKNNYKEVEQWNYKVRNFVNTGLQFCGLVMGDHSKCSINTMFNTGTVVGVSANIFGIGFPPKFVPSFTWGAIENSETFQLHKSFEVAERMMGRRNLSFTNEDRLILMRVFENSAVFRTWEKDTATPITLPAHEGD